MNNSATLSQPEGVTEALNRAAVETLAQSAPEWLSAQRLEAWTLYEDMPFPTTRSELWRYTDLSRKLKLDGMVLSEEYEAEDFPTALTAAMDEDRESSGRIVEIDGRVVSVQLDEALVEQGVVLASLRQAVVEHEDLVRPYLCGEAVPASDGKFPALNAALWTDGVFLHVPKDVVLEHPIRLTRWVDQEGSVGFSRVLIVAERTCQVSFVDEILSPDFEKQTLVSTVVEVYAQDGARVQYVSLQRMGRGGFYLANQRTLAQRDAKLDTLNVGLGASIGRVELNARLLGSGADSDMLGLYFADGDQHFDFNTSQDHVAPNAHSDLLYKGALDGNSRGVFRGIIRVHKDAQGTDAYQTNRNLLLSENAEADSLPNLEIEADDVRCSHGATIGQLDAESLFYLMSRGLEREQAERLVVLGFLGEVLNRLPLGGVVEKVTRAIETKLGNIGFGVSSDRAGAAFGGS